VNAIEAAIPVLQGLESLRKALVEERTPESSLFDDVPFSVLTIAGVQAGKAINIMPEECAIDVGVRLLPGQHAEEFLPRVHALVEGAGLRVGDKPEPEGCVLEVLNNTPAFGTPGDDPFLGRVMKLVDASEAHGVSYGTDAGRLEALGCRSVVFGPGDISVAHKPDEWMPIDEFERAPGLLRSLIAKAI
jgi:acetylornithine deacetylase